METVLNPFTLLAILTLGGVWLWVRRRDDDDSHPPYDGSVVIIDLPRFNPPPAVVRDNSGRFAKGSKPIAARGPNGRFAKAA